MCCQRWSINEIERSLCTVILLNFQESNSHLIVHLERNFVRSECNKSYNSIDTFAINIDKLGNYIAFVIDPIFALAVVRLVTLRDKVTCGDDPTHAQLSRGFRATVVVTQFFTVVFLTQLLRCFRTWTICTKTRAYLIVYAKDSFSNLMPLRE